MKVAQKEVSLDYFVKEEVILGSILQSVAVMNTNLLRPSSAMDKRTVIGLLKATCDGCAKRHINKPGWPSDTVCKRGGYAWRPITHCGCNEYFALETCLEEMGCL